MLKVSDSIITSLAVVASSLVLTVVNICPSTIVMHDWCHERLALDFGCHENKIAKSITVRLLFGRRYDMVSCVEWHLNFHPYISVRNKHSRASVLRITPSHDSCRGLLASSF